MPDVRLYCALDARDRDAVEALAARLAPAVDGFKLGLEYFCAHGPEGLRGVVALGRPDPRVTAAQTINARSALAAALLLLPEEFSREDLLASLCGLSYAGDVRVTLGAAEVVHARYAVAVAFVEVEGARIRQAPFGAAPAVAAVGPGDPVTVVERDGAWVRVARGGRTGWVLQQEIVSFQ